MVESLVTRREVACDDEEHVKDFLELIDLVIAPHVDIPCFLFNLVPHLLLLSLQLCLLLCNPLLPLGHINSIASLLFIGVVSAVQLLFLDLQACLLEQVVVQDVFLYYLLFVGQGLRVLVRFRVLSQAGDWLGHLDCKLVNNAADD